jgi:hypothetical protein
MNTSSFGYPERRSVREVNAIIYGIKNILEDKNEFMNFLIDTITANNKIVGDSLEFVVKHSFVYFNLGDDEKEKLIEQIKHKRQGQAA